MQMNHHQHAPMLAVPRIACIYCALMIDMLVALAIYIEWHWYGKPIRSTDGIWGEKKKIEASVDWKTGRNIRGEMGGG